MSVKSLNKTHFTISSTSVKLNNVQNAGMLLVHSKNCGHCTRFIPTYKQLAESLGSKFPLMAVEAVNMPMKMADMLKLQGYPSIYFFDKTGTIISEYDGADRELATIKKHICKVYHYCNQ
jgi:thioredoxin-like negative regulator of GroEL